MVDSLFNGSIADSVEGFYKLLFLSDSLFKDGFNHPIILQMSEKTP